MPKNKEASSHHKSKNKRAGWRAYRLSQPFEMPYDRSVNRPAFKELCDNLADLAAEDPACAEVSPLQIGAFTIYLLRGYIRHPLLDGPVQSIYGLEEKGKHVLLTDIDVLREWSGFEMGVKPEYQAIMHQLIEASKPLS